MSKTYRYYQIDSFTKEKFSGNPAGVILNADGLTAQDMQKIAREVNNSETAFIFKPSNDSFDVEVRFFTPTNEVPICGHATIAAHYALAMEHHLKTTTIRQKTGAGILPVDILKENKDYRIVMTQGTIAFGDVLSKSQLSSLLSALNMESDDLLENFPVQIVSTGHSKVMIGIKDKERLDNLHPNFNRLIEISRAIQCNGFYVFTIDPTHDVLIHGRMFAPAIGIPEDPVTGNANGPLGAYLVHYKKVYTTGNQFCFRAVQGEAIHRAGTIDVAVSIQSKEPYEVKISGNATVVFQSELTID